MTRITLGDVARHANVSETTASHVMTGSRPVAEETRRRVLDSVRELGYRPNLVAKALRSQTTRTITIMVPDISNPAYTASIRGASQHLSSTGYSTTIVDTADRVPGEREITAALDGIPTGVIFLGFGPDQEAEDLLLSYRVPFVVGGLGRGTENAWDIVYTDQESAVASVSNHLATTSGRRGCFFGGDVGDEGAQARLRGYLRGLESAGFAPDDECVDLVPYSIDGGRAAMLAHRYDPPSWVIAGNDLIGIGVIIVARDLGIRVPDDLQVIGFDNILACEAVSPTLSSIDVELSDQGRECANILLERIENGSSSVAVKRRIETRWVPRDSTRIDPEGGATA